MYMFFPVQYSAELQVRMLLSSIDSRLRPLFSIKNIEDAD